MRIQDVKNGYSYPEFVALCEELLSKGLTTSNSEKPDFIHFAKLNLQRMRRYDKTLELSSAIAEHLEGVEGRWWVITEGWCGDSAHSLPVIAQFAKLAGVDLKIILRDENPEIMDQFLTNGSRSIPILVAEKPDGTLVQWGPRPSGASEIGLHYRNNKDTITFEEFEMQLQKWYNKDKGEEIVQEIIALIKK